MPRRFQLPLLDSVDWKILQMSAEKLWEPSNAGSTQMDQLRERLNQKHGLSLGALFSLNAVYFQNLTDRNC